jgi:hypothetical protein
LLISTHPSIVRMFYQLGKVKTLIEIGQIHTWEFDRIHTVHLQNA